MKRPGPATGFRITARDREIVRWVGRLRMATATQVARRFELGRAVSYARLRGLVQLGLLDHVRIFHATAGVYTATKTGLRAADLDLPAARVDLRTYTHDIELTSLVADLEQEFGRDRLVTEREMRAVDMPLSSQLREHPRFAVPLTSGRGQLKLTPVGRPRLHFPDCAVVDSSERVLAVELERTAKGRARLRRIVAGYVSARHIDNVRYYTSDPRVTDLVSSTVETMRAAQLIDIRVGQPSGCLDLQTASAA